MEKHNILLVFILALFTTSSNALKCYVCSKSASDSSDLCIYNPESVSSVDCGAKYCTIKRQEYKNPPGTVASFYRGCENNPVYLNTMIEDENFKTYFRACTRDLCNIGNGIQLVNQNPGTGGSSVGFLMVPGIGRNIAYTNKQNYISILAIVVLHLFLLLKYFLNN